MRARRWSLRVSFLDVELPWRCGGVLLFRGELSRYLIDTISGHMIAESLQGYILYT